MAELNGQMQVGRLVAERPARSRVFEGHGIDYCCGGKRTVEDVCREGGLDPVALLDELQVVEADSDDGIDPAGMTMTALTDHIEETHHVFLRRELPRLMKLVDKVVAAHGDGHPWLAEVRAILATLSTELQQHMMKEERILFPLIRQLDEWDGTSTVDRGNVNGPIYVMEHEHEDAGAALLRLRTLTKDFTPPKGACNSFRALLDGLETLEADTHQHIHEENNVLFVAAARAEERSRNAAP